MYSSERCSVPVVIGGTRCDAGPETVALVPLSGKHGDIDRAAEDDGEQRIPLTAAAEWTKPSVEEATRSMRGINHVVLYVSDLSRSLAFYEKVLGFQRLPGAFPGGAFLRHAGSANDHDLGLFESRGAAIPAPGSIGLYHVAWEVETLAELSAVWKRLSDAGALTGAGDHGSTKALYGRDPDGIEFEVCWLVPDEHVEEALRPGASLTAPLDLAAEIERYGASSPGGPRADPTVWARVAARHAAQ